MTDIRALQQRLEAAGFDPGGVDGIAGAHTYAALCGYVAGRELGTAGASLGHGMAAYCADFSDLDLAHYLGQTAKETEGFQFFSELGGPDYCARYDHRADLGNCQAGDGYRFRGRGPLMLTGRANYAHMAGKTAADLIIHPEIVADPDFGTRVAVIFWRERGITAAAEADDCEHVTRLVNGGLNGFLDRQRYTARAKTMLGLG